MQAPSIGGLSKQAQNITFLQVLSQKYVGYRDAMCMNMSKNSLKVNRFISSYQSKYFARRNRIVYLVRITVWRALSSITSKKSKNNSKNNTSQLKTLSFQIMFYSIMGYFEERFNLGIFGKGLF